MSTINTVNRVGFASAGQTDASKKTSTSNAASFKEEFSAMLTKMKENKSPSGGSDDSSDSEKTTTVTQVMSDGSVLVTVYKDDKIISQTKSRAAKADENATVLSTQTEQAVPSNSNPLNNIDANAQVLSASEAASALSTIWQS